MVIAATTLGPPSSPSHPPTHQHVQVFSEKKKAVRDEDNNFPLSVFLTPTHAPSFSIPFCANDVQIAGIILCHGKSIRQLLLIIIRSSRGSGRSGSGILAIITCLSAGRLVSSAASQPAPEPFTHSSSSCCSPYCASSISTCFMLSPSFAYFMPNESSSGMMKDSAAAAAMLDKTTVMEEHATCVGLML